MTTHGETGKDRAQLGNIARRVVKHATLPLLLARADRDVPIYPVATIWDVTVALDGSDKAETALGVATRLASTLAVPLTLLHVVPDAFFVATVTRGYEASSYRMQDEMDAYHCMREERAAAYLDAVAARIALPGLIVRTVVTRSVTNRAGDGLAAYLTKRPHTLAVIAREERADAAWWSRGEMLKGALAQMPCALLIVPAGATNEPIGEGEHEILWARFPARVGTGYVLPRTPV